MKMVDRVIYGALALGLWGVFFQHAFDSAEVMAIEAYEIDGLRDEVRLIVEGCQVYVHTISGEVLVYGGGYGEITSASGYGQLSC